MLTILYLREITEGSDLLRTTTDFPHKLPFASSMKVISDFQSEDIEIQADSQSHRKITRLASSTIVAPSTAFLSFKNIIKFTTKALMSLNHWLVILCYEDEIFRYHMKVYS